MVSNQSITDAVFWLTGHTPGQSCVTSELGRQIIETPDGLFDSPINIRRELTLLSLMALADLKRVVINGQSRRRIFRLTKNDQSFVEVVPQWRAALEQRAIHFLTHALPEKVVVEQPQSLFAAVRAEGPETEA